MTATAAKALFASHHPEDASAVVTPARGLAGTRSRRERDDDYFKVICRIDDRTRVIECADAIQWIIQSWQGGCWRSRSFHLSRDLLIERSSATGAALATLRALPERHP
jgi:hypothetical protein